MKISIINNQPIYGIDYSNRADCSEVFDMEEQDFAKIQAGTHTLDLETKELVEVPVEEPKKLTKAEKDAIAEAEAKALEEVKIQETEKLILRKQALELLWKDTTDITAELVKIQAGTHRLEWKELVEVPVIEEEVVIEELAEEDLIS